MGGYGSTRWGNYAPRYTTDDALALDIVHLRTLYSSAEDIERRRTGSMRTVIWKRNGHQLGEIGIRVHWYEGVPVGELVYTLNGTPTRQLIRIDTTSPNYGGVRFWWNCPDCGGRCRKLFLPPGGQGFACRDCHNLTYYSSQSSRKWGGELGAAINVIKGYERLEKLERKYLRAYPGSKRSAHLEQQLDKLEIKMSQCGERLRKDL